MLWLGGAGRWVQRSVAILSLIYLEAMSYVTEFFSCQSLSYIFPVFSLPSGEGRLAVTVWV